MQKTLKNTPDCVNSAESCTCCTAEHAVMEFWRQQGAPPRDNFTRTVATSAENDTFYQIGRQRIN